MGELSPERAPIGGPLPPKLPEAWEFGEIGFDTDKRLWFVQLFNQNNQNVGTYLAEIITLKRGRAAQYQWKDAQGRPFWHIRERFFADDVAVISLEPPTRLTVTFKEGKIEAGDSVPQHFSYLLYAYHLTNREIAKGNRSPLGFVEFFDEQGEVIARLNNRWIIIEDIERVTFGEFPKVRLRVEKKDIDNIISTRTTLIIQGKGVAKATAPRQ